MKTKKNLLEVFSTHGWGSAPTILQTAFVFAEVLIDIRDILQQIANKGNNNA